MHSKLYSLENYFNLLESWNAVLISIIQLFYGVVCLTLKDKNCLSPTYKWYLSHKQLIRCHHLHKTQNLWYFHTSFSLFWIWLCYHHHDVKVNQIIMSSSLSVTFNETIRNNPKHFLKRITSQSKYIWHTFKPLHNWTKLSRRTVFWKMLLFALKMLLWIDRSLQLIDFISGIIQQMCVNKQSSNAKDIKEIGKIKGTTFFQHEVFFIQICLTFLHSLTILS